MRKGRRKPDDLLLPTPVGVTFALRVVFECFRLSDVGSYGRTRLPEAFIGCRRNRRLQGQLGCPRNSWRWPDPGRAPRRTPAPSRVRPRHASHQRRWASSASSLEKGPWRTSTRVPPSAGRRAMDARVAWKGSHPGRRAWREGPCPLQTPTPRPGRVRSAGRGHFHEPRALCFRVSARRGSRELIPLRSMRAARAATR